MISPLWHKVPQSPLLDHHHLRCSWPFFFAFILQPNQQCRIIQWKQLDLNHITIFFWFYFVSVLIWGCVREVAVSQLQFREESDDLTGIPEGVPTPAGREICHHIQVELHTSPLLLQVPAYKNTTLEMLNAIYLCWFIIPLLRNKYNLTIPWAAGRHCGKAAFFPLSILPL